MKKIFIIAVSLFTAVSALAQENKRTTQVLDGTETLYIIDGVASKKLYADMLSNDEIRCIETVKGINQAVVISTKNGKTAYGRIVEANGNPIIGALVKVKGTPIGTATDSNGYFDIHISADQSQLEISHKEYETVILNISKANLGSIVMYTSAAAKTNAQDIAEDTPTPLYIAKDRDGNTYVINDMASITVDQIKSLNVSKKHKDLEEYKSYGDTSNGVVFIELK